MVSVVGIYEGGVCRGGELQSAKSQFQVCRRNSYFEAAPKHKTQIVPAASLSVEIFIPSYLRNCPIFSLK